MARHWTISVFVYQKKQTINSLPNFVLVKCKCSGQGWYQLGEYHGNAPSPPAEEWISLTLHLWQQGPFQHGVGQRNTRQATEECAI